jgi:carboxyl-terminal processing protease
MSKCGDTKNIHFYKSTMSTTMMRNRRLQIQRFIVFLGLTASACLLSSTDAFVPTTLPFGNSKIPVVSMPKNDRLSSSWTLSAFVTASASASASSTVDDTNHLAHPQAHVESHIIAPSTTKKEWTSTREGLTQKLSVAVLTVSLALTTMTASFAPLPAVASDYGSLTTEQKTVAEAWRLVDNSFLDRTFNGQDWFQLRQKYVTKKYANMDEARTSIDAMISTLGDKYTRYLPPAKYQSIVDTATGTVAGCGIEINLNKEGRVIASDVEETGPAKAGGVLTNDIFVEVDGYRFDTGTATPDDVAVRLRGPQGSKVGVVMERNGKTLDYILTRQPIKITAVKSYLSNVPGVGKVGVIRIKSFSGTTAATVSDEFNALKKKGAQAYVIDVRGNPGGLLPGGADTAALFLDADKPLVFVANKKGVVDAQSTLATGIDIESPIVLLVDSKTASAAEVFTAALKENGRATVAGEQTFGKGIVQTIRPLADNNGGIAITVARYETPQHHDINKQGIPVDTVTPVDCAKDDATACLTSAVFKKPLEQS